MNRLKYPALFGLLLLSLITYSQGLYVGAFALDLPDCHDSTATFKAYPYGVNTTPTYLWSNGSTNDTVSGLLPGTYTVTMTSTNPVGSVIDTFTVYPWASKTITTKVECNHTLDGGLYVAYQSLKAPLLVDWYFNGTYSTSTNYNQPFSVQMDYIQHGSYNGYLTDADGCHDTLQIIVGESNPVDYFHIYLSDSTLCCGDTTRVWFSPPGMPLYDSPFTTSDTFTVMNICSHLYYPDGYALVDTFGCGVDANLPITYYQIPPTYTWEYAINTGFDGSFYVNGSSSSTYQWYHDNTAIPGADSSAFTPTQPGIYNVVETNVFGCEKSYGSVTYTNVPGHSLQNMVIYPNPVADLLFIRSEQALNELEVIDAVGRVIKCSAIKSATNEYFIPVKDLPAGSYTLKTGSKATTFIKAGN